MRTVCVCFGREFETKPLPVQRTELNNVARTQGCKFDASAIQIGAMRTRLIDKLILAFIAADERMPARNIGFGQDQILICKTPNRGRISNQGEDMITRTV